MCWVAPFSTTRINAINELPEPKDIKQLQSFLGGINCYSQFVPNMADIAKPLYLFT